MCDISNKVNFSPHYTSIMMVTTRGGQKTNCFWIYMIILHVFLNKPYCTPQVKSHAHTLHFTAVLAPQGYGGHLPSQNIFFHPFAPPPSQISKCVKISPNVTIFYIFAPLKKKKKIAPLCPPPPQIDAGAVTVLKGSNMKNWNQPLCTWNFGTRSILSNRVTFLIPLFKVLLWHFI